MKKPAEMTAKELRDALAEAKRDEQQKRAEYWAAQQHTQTITQEIAGRMLPQYNYAVRVSINKHALEDYFSRPNT